MKFLIDENVGKSVAYFLNQFGHTSFRVKKISPGAEDVDVLELALKKEAILITLDKDFGELIFRQGKVHGGVIFLRVEDQASSGIQKALSWFLAIYSQDQIIKSFVVVTEKAGKFKARFDS